MSSANLWIKICGNTSLEDAQLAADAGADAVGFVFAPSPRRVTPALVAAIVPQLPATLEKIGVFVDAPFAEIEATVQTSALTGVQLHFAAPPELPARLRAHFGPSAAHPSRNSLRPYYHRRVHFRHAGPQHRRGARGLPHRLCRRRHRHHLRLDNGQPDTLPKAQIRASAIWSPPAA